MTMTSREYLYKYKSFNELAKKIKREHRKLVLDSLNKELFLMINKDFKLIIIGFLYERLEHNINNIGNIIEKKSKKFNFLISESNIIKSFCYYWLFASIKEHIKSSIKKLMKNICDFTENNTHEDYIYKVKIPVLSYPECPNINYVFYVNIEYEWCISAYKAIYVKQLLSSLLKIYKRPLVFSQVNVNNINIVSEDNFLEKEAFSEISQYNIKRFLNRLFDIINNGYRVITDDDLIICYQVKVIQNILNIIKINALEKNSKIEVKEEKKSKINKSNSKIKNIIIRTLKNLGKQNEYLFFHTEKELLEIILERYPNFNRIEIKEVFSEVVDILPSGMIRFTIPESQKFKEQIYFIPLIHVANVFIQFKLDSESQFNLKETSQRHFFLFLQKLLKNYDLFNYSDEKIAFILKCDINLIKKMRQVILNTQ